MVHLLRFKRRADGAAISPARKREYPSRAVFLQLVASPEVQEIGEWRARGLDGQWLIATTTATAL